MLDAFWMSLLLVAPEERMFGLDMQTMMTVIPQAINIAILAAVLYLLLYKPVRNFLKKRADKIQGQVDHAQKDMDTARDLKAQYEKSLEEVGLERTSILEEAYRVASEKSRGIIQDGRQDAEALRARALTDIEKEQEQAREALKLYIITLASAMAEKIVVHSIDQETQERLFQETMAELEDKLWPR